jgi:acetyl esterase/lipase
MTKNLQLLKVENFVVSVLYHAMKTPKDIIHQRINVTSRDGGIIKIDVYRPKTSNNVLPVLMYYPGGGFIMSASHFHKKNLMNMVRLTHSVGIIVHYRLAPKYPFPTAFYDAIDAWDYVVNHASELQIDPKRLALCGDSAGGNLACGIALYNQDHLKKDVSALFLVYPGLDKGQNSYTRKHYIDVPMFNASMFPLIEKVFYKNGTGDLEKYAFPLFHGKPYELPPVYLETAEFDCLLDDGLQFHQLLKENGIEVTLNQTKGTVHGYDIVQTSSIVKESFNQRIAFLKRYL